MAFSWFRALWAPPRRGVTPLHVVVYTRQGCHLCDEALTLLGREQRRYGFTLETVDVDSDPELRAKYDECVPVVMVNGKVRFRGTVNSHLVRRLFEAGAGRA